MSDQEFDPTTTSTEAFLQEHGVLFDGDGPGEYGAPYCKCGGATADELASHLFDASRSIMYRESAAVCQYERNRRGEEAFPGLHLAFQIMLDRAEAAELSGPTSEPSASV